MASDPTPDAADRDPSADLEAALGAAWTSTEPWAFITDLTAIGSRMGGSAGEARAAERVAEAFESVGVRDVREQPFDVRQWRRGETTLELTAPGGREFEAIALPYSPAGEIAGELVDVGYGTPAEIDAEDVAGKVAVASTTTPGDSRFIHRMEKFAYAVEQGATAFVFVNHKPGQLPPTGSLTFGGEADAVAVGVSAETGDWLREFAADTPGETGRVRLAVDCETVPSESRNVLGHLGPDTDEEYLLVAHYDGHDVAEAALDNGCGIATVVAAADVLAEADLEVGVRVAAVGCEEVGLLGAEHLAEAVDLESVRAVVNVDGAGRFRDLIALSHTSEATADVAETVAAATRHPIEVEDEPHPFSDQWPFVREGVPALQLHSDSGERGRGWGHTHADTRDKVDDRNIREHGMLAALLLLELQASDRELPRLDAGELADAFREADFETGMRAADLWPAEWE